jgi:endonuclease/exonuclease/phosphatase family metal-dependent hydrolase
VELFVEATDELPVVAHDVREGLLARSRDPAVHARAQAELPGLRRIEVAAPPPGAAPLREARVLVWNAERGRSVEGAARMLRAAAPDVLLLSELDVGMARSDQRHTPRALAAELGMGFAFAVEFLELELGNDAERLRCSGQRNAIGYHGGAIASPQPLERPALVRLDAGGDWFDGLREEWRVGGRIALLATLRIADTPVALVSTHLESHAGPALRDAQTAALLAALDVYAPGAPALVGGDFNTHSLELAELEDRGALLRALRAEPRRFANPVPHEPLFARLERAGFDRLACNLTEEPTQRVRMPDESYRGALKLDWAFTRGLEARDPAVVPAIDPASGQALSDHDAVSVTIRPLRRGLGAVD